MRPLGEGFPFLAFICDRRGWITRVLRDDVGAVEPFPLPRPFAAMVAGEERTKTVNLFSELREKGIALDWEFNLPVGEAMRTFHFYACAVGGDFLVVGAESERQVTVLFQEMLEMDGGRIDAPMEAVRGLLAQARERHVRESDLYDQLTRMNNEMAAMQRELARKNASLERMNEEKNRFLGIVAHDLRSPISTILVAAKFLLSTLADRMKDAERDALNAIVRYGEFTLRLIDDLLDISAIESGRLELSLQDTDMGELVERVVSLHKNVAAERNVELVVHPPAGGARAEADPARMEQVLNNLVVNALKFSPSGSRVDITITGDGERLTVAVKDMGPGIPADELDRLFKPFGTTSVKSAWGEKSTGLGLAIVRRIVEAHGGTVGVESESGQGSTFYFTLPRRQ